MFLYLYRLSETRKTKPPSTCFLSKTQELYLTNEDTRDLKNSWHVKIEIIHESRNNQAKNRQGTNGIQDKTVQNHYKRLDFNYVVY